MRPSSVSPDGPDSHFQALNEAPHAEVRGHRPLPFFSFSPVRPPLLSLPFSLPTSSLFLPTPSPISRCAAPRRASRSPRTLAGTQSPTGGGALRGAGSKKEGAERGGEGPATLSLD